MEIDLFNEIYGCYYSTVFHILKEANSKDYCLGEFRKKINELSETYGFSFLTAEVIGKAINNGLNSDIQDRKDAWRFIEVKDDYEYFKAKKKEHEEAAKNNRKPREISPLPTQKIESRLKNIKSFPLSTLEKRWLKTVYSDPRIKLFLDDPLPEEFDSVEPLFSWSDFVLFDQFSDGDNFEDDHYKEMFRIALKAIHDKSRLEIKVRKQTNSIDSFDSHLVPKAESLIERTIYIDPSCIEYSERDNRFRIIGNNPRFGKNTVNISSIESCRIVPVWNDDNSVRTGINSESDSLKEIMVDLKDENDALERFLFAFSHCENEVDYDEEEVMYHIKLKYDKTDETDILIRILSFGPRVKVISPNEFVEKIKDRLRKQTGYKNC